MYFKSFDSSKIVKHSKMQARFLDNTITNFEYLMFMNQISNQSFLNYQQYPIFPWVLTEYSQSQIEEADYRNMKLDLLHLGSF